jgi:hypothetical protein
MPANPSDYPGRFLSTADENDSGEYEYVSVYIPSVNGWINPNNPEEVFLIWKQLNEGFDVTCEICATVQPATTQTGSCVDLPDHAIPNIATEITQYTGTDGWFPSTDYTYNTLPSTTDCTFVCENNYSRVDGECKENEIIRECVGGMPQYAVLTVPGANTYTSTRNGSGWDPSIRTYTYNPTVYSDPALNACNYKCPEHYTRNGGACIADHNTGICGGILPANAYTTNGTGFYQIRNGDIIPA